MRTLVRTSMVVSMALAFLWMTAPAGYTGEFLCANCGKEITFLKCPPGVKKPQDNYNCYDVKDTIRPNWSLNFRSGAVVVSAPEDPNLAHGLSPAWSNGAPDESTACPNCGVHFTTDSRMKALATQP
jgi:predicted RNA-binding Zn-ribbon protein involved in translation (DUF1610 family)